MLKRMFAFAICWLNFRPCWCAWMRGTPPNKKCRLRVLCATRRH